MRKYFPVITPGEAAARCFYPFSVALMALGLATQANAFTVLNPPAAGATISAGNDYATQVLGDAWDMNDPLDVDTDESSNIAAETFASGLYSGTASCTSSAADFYPVFMGYGAQTVAVSRGRLHPIDTSVYRYLTIKMKTDTAQPVHAFFFKDGDSYSNATFGATHFQSLAANQWTIFTWDLVNDTYGPPDGYKLWTTYAQIQGIRFDPCNSGTANFQVDWIRLTAAPDANQKYTVTWTDTGSTSYSITAIDSAAVRFQIAAGVPGRTFAADMSRLPPGDYQVEVRRSDNSATATSAGQLHVNAPPQLVVIAPSAHGEQSQSYAVTQQGGQWGPMSAADFSPSPPPNFTNVSYTNPVGSFSGRPSNGDPNFIMKTTGHPIDASFYRSACFTMEVFGPRNVGPSSGSVARLFWKLASSAVTTTTDIILSSGLTEYCLADLSDSTAVPLEPSSPAPQPWAGSLTYFRLDPEEFTPPAGCNTPASCHDVRLDSVILAPFSSAAPAYVVRWTLTADVDYPGTGGSTEIYLDADQIPGNGNEFLVGSAPYTSGAYQYKIVAGHTVPDGTYNLYIRSDDGLNSVVQYASGPILVNSDDVIFLEGFDGLE